MVVFVIGGRRVQKRNQENGRVFAPT